MSFVIKSFLNGSDGVLIVGCRLGECNYITHGNYHALNMVTLCKKILKEIGVNPERLSINFMSSAEGMKFARTVTEFSNKIKEIGPLAEGEGIDRAELKARLEKIQKLVPYIKVAERDKLQTHFDNVEEYETLYSDEEVKKLITEVPSYYIDPEKCQACGTCRRRCPVDAISGDKNIIHVIDQDKCIKCGTCYESCPPKFSAVTKIVGDKVPDPLPEDKRKIDRKKKK